MKSIKGTRTEQNLLKAFAGESQARKRHTLFAYCTRKESYKQTAAILDKTAAQKQEHAEDDFARISYGKQTTRKPCPLLPLPGSENVRFDTRQYTSLSQLPPRETRLLPYDGPVGFV